MQRIIAEVATIAAASMFFGLLGAADALKDEQKKKGLCFYAIAFGIGFIIGALWFA